MTSFSLKAVLFGGILAIAVIATTSLVFAQEAKLGGLDATISSEDTIDAVPADGGVIVPKPIIPPVAKLTAADVGAGTFGANTGGGSYVFPGYLYANQVVMQQGHLYIGTDAGFDAKINLTAARGPVETGMLGMSGIGSDYGNGYEWTLTMSNQYPMNPNAGILALKAWELGGQRASNVMEVWDFLGIKKVSFDRMLELSPDGIRFADGSVQTSAAGAGATSNKAMLVKGVPAAASCTDAGRFTLDSVAQKLYVCLGQGSWSQVQMTAVK